MAVLKRDGRYIYHLVRRGQFSVSVKSQQTDGLRCVVSLTVCPYRPSKMPQSWPRAHSDPGLVAIWCPALETCGCIPTPWEKVVIFTKALLYDVRKLGMLPLLSFLHCRSEIETIKSQETDCSKEFFSHSSLPNAVPGNTLLLSCLLPPCGFLPLSQWPLTCEGVQLLGDAAG